MGDKIMLKLSDILLIIERIYCLYLKRLHCFRLTDFIK